MNLRKKMYKLSMENYTYDQLNQILDTQFCVYNYTTLDYESGTIIVNKKLSPIVDEQNLFDMNNMNMKMITLRDLLENGFISVGSVDIMDTMKITYPSLQYSDITNFKTKPKIEGKYIHGSRKKLIIDPTGIDFDLDPDDSEDKSDNDTQ